LGRKGRAETGGKDLLKKAMADKALKKLSTNKEVKDKLLEVYDEIFAHNGYGEIKVDMRILHRGQKEIIIYCGKQYRFVVNFNMQAESKSLKREACSVQCAACSV